MKTCHETKSFRVLSQDGDHFYVRVRPMNSLLGTRLIKGANRGEPPQIINKGMPKHEAIKLADAWEAYLSQDVRKAKKNRRLDAIRDKYLAAMGETVNKHTGFNQ